MYRFSEPIRLIGRSNTYKKDIDAQANSREGSGVYVLFGYTRLCLICFAQICSPLKVLGHIGWKIGYMCFFAQIFCVYEISIIYT